MCPAVPPPRPFEGDCPIHAPVDRSGDSEPKALQGLADALRARGEGQVRLDEVLDALGASAHPPILFTLALPMCVPMVPGIPTVAGLLLSFTALLWLVGRDEMELPARVARADVSAARLATWVGRLDRFIAPLSGESRALGVHRRRVAALLVVVLGIVMALPIPFVGNIPPAIAVTTLALAFIDRSPRLYAIGVVLSVLALALAGLFAFGLVQAGGAAVEAVT